MQLGATIVVALALVASTATATVDEPRVPGTRTAEDVPANCPVTKPPAHPFILPVPRSEWPHPREFWFGTRKLWTVLPVDGTWKGLPHYIPDDPTFRNKLFWWRHGNDKSEEAQPRLAVAGRRLDAPAPPLLVDRISNYWPQPDQTFKVVGVNFPTLGCWEIKGQYQDAEVTYIVWITQ